MSTQEKLVGNWNQIKGKVKQRWGQLTDDELSEVEGHFDQLVGLVQQKTGEAAKISIAPSANSATKPGALHASQRDSSRVCGPGWRKASRRCGSDS